MTEKIPQHVILDLLPLYIGGELSNETHSLIEAYLNQDPQLAKLVEQAKNVPSLQDVPAPLQKENEMEALKKVKKLMIQHNIFLVIAVILTLMIGLSYLFLGDEPRGAAAPLIFGGLAVFFWIAFFMVNRKINE